MRFNLIAVLVTAFVLLPTAAFAENSPELTYPTGTRLATESKVRSVNVGNVNFTSSAGTTACTSLSLTGTLNKNNGSELEASLESGSLTGAGVDKRCIGPSQYWTGPGAPWCLRSTPELTEDEFQIRGGSCSKSAEAIKLSFTKPVVLTECAYEKTTPIIGTFKTDPTEDALFTSKEVEYTRVSGVETCPITTKLDTTLTFEKAEAFTAPLYISSGPRVTYPTGTSLAAESKIKAHNVGVVSITTSLGTMECSFAEAAGTLNSNTGTEFKMTIESAAFKGTSTEELCTSPFGNTEWTFNTATNGVPWCLQATSAMKTDEYQIRGNSCAGASRPIRAVVETTTTTTCSYERKAAIGGTFTTHPEDALLRFTDDVFLETEPRQSSCPDETQMDASLTLEREEAGTHPMYID